MQKLYIPLLISLSVFIASQDISDSYLKSLPEDIREDVIERMDNSKDLEKEVYRSIETSSTINKLNQKDKDKLFGSDFFDTMQTSFMPINLPNLGDDYVLDFGDVLSIQLVGQNDSLNSYPLSRDGSINIADIGKIFLAGLTLSEASKSISSKIKQTYIGVEAYTSLENIRDVSVLVSGDAYNPGIYTLNGSSNMLHAIYAAGGIGEYGSYRSIKLIRDNKIIDSIDVYDILIKGKFGSKTRLRSGDMIFVEPRSHVITLEGAFKRSALYELLEGQKLSDAIYYANGVSADADFSNIYLYRLSNGKIKDISITDLSQFNAIDAKDLDRLFIRNHSFRNVSISGAVLRPGSYKMIEGDSIFDLIEKAGGYTLNAYPKGAIYLNEEAKKINSNATLRLYNEFIDGLLEVIQKSSAGETDITSLVTIASELKNSEPNARIVIDLTDDSSTTLIRNDDNLYIPEKSNNVFIYGEVLNEGSLIYKNGADIDFYLQEASGLKQTADDDAIFILYPNGRTAQLYRKRNLFASQPQEIIIDPGSVIYVPRKIDDTLSSRLTAQAYASILGNIGLTLASISSINNNK